MDVPGDRAPATDPESASVPRAIVGAALAGSRSSIRRCCRKILDHFPHHSSVWTTKQYRRKIRMHALTPELTEEEATRLLPISSVRWTATAEEPAILAQLSADRPSRWR